MKDFGRRAGGEALQFGPGGLRPVFSELGAVVAATVVLGLAFAGFAGASAAPESDVQKALAPKDKLRVALLNGDATQAVKDFPLRS